MRTRPAASSAASPVSPLPGVVVHHGQVRGALPDQRVDQASPASRPCRSHRSSIVEPSAISATAASASSVIKVLMTAHLRCSPPRPRAPGRHRCRSPPRPSVRRRSCNTVRQRAEDAASGGAQRMTDGDRAAAYVDDLGIDLPGVDAREGLHGEGLVQLDRGPTSAQPMPARRSACSAASTGAYPNIGGPARARRDRRSALREPIRCGPRPSRTEQHGGARRR